MRCAGLLFFVFCNMLRVIVCDGDSQSDQTLVSLRIWIDNMFRSSRREISKMCCVNLNFSVNT